MRYGIMTLCVAATLLASVGTARADQMTPEKLVKTQLEIDALTTLYDLTPTSEQLKALSDLSDTTAGSLPASAGVINWEYVTALSNLHDALLTQDEDKIDAAEQKVSDLEDKLSIVTPTVKLTDEACVKSVDALKLLTPHQVAEYLAQNADEIPDAAALISQALDQCRTLPKDQFEDLRQDVADEISVLAGFKNTAAAKPVIHQRIINFLNRVRDLSADDFNTQRPALDKEARDMVKEIGPITGIRSWMQRELAELLANPELPRALAEYQRIVPAN